MIITDEAIGLGKRSKKKAIIVDTNENGVRRINP